MTEQVIDNQEQKIEQSIETLVTNESEVEEKVPPIVEEIKAEQPKIDTKRLIELQKLERKNREREERLKKLQQEEFDKLSKLKEEKDPFKILKEFDIKLEDLNNSFLNEVNKEPEDLIKKDIEKLKQELEAIKKEKETLELQNKVNTIVSKTKEVLSDESFEFCREYGQAAMDEIHTLISKEWELENPGKPITFEEIEKRLLPAAKAVEAEYEEMAAKVLRMNKVKKKIEASVPKKEVKIEEVKVEQVKPATTTISQPVQLTLEEKDKLFAQRLQASWDAQKNKRK